VRKCRSDIVRNDTVPWRETAVARRCRGEHCHGETLPSRDNKGAVARHCCGETMPWRGAAMVRRAAESRPWGGH
jgi:hypothetical protein